MKFLPSVLLRNYTAIASFVRYTDIVTRLIQFPLNAFELEQANIGCLSRVNAEL